MDDRPDPQPGGAYDFGLARAFERVRATVEASLRRLIDAAPDAIVIVDSRGRIVLVNAQAQSLFGFPTAELLGRPIEVLVPERYRSAHLADRDSFLGHPATRPMGLGLELFGLRRDGSEFPVEISLSPFESEDGPLVISAIRDMTRHRQADEARAYLAAIVQSSEDAIVGHSPDNVITAWNPAAERTYGWPAGEAIGRPSSLTVPDDRRAELMEMLSAVRAGQTRVLETTRVRRDGTLLHVSISGAPIADSAGRIVGAATIERDVSERIRAEAERARLAEEREAREKAEAGVRARDEFLSVAAHELKTPLAVLKGYAQLIQRGVAGGVGGEWLSEHLAVFSQHTDKMTSLVEQLLDVSRVEADRLTLDTHPVDLRAVVDEAVASTLARHPNAPPIRISAEADLVVRGDTLRLEQVLVNVLDNSIKFSPDGQPIDVTLTADQHEVRVAVRDRGLGVPPERRARIFDRFYQAHQQEHRSGMGIGLYISRRIAELHGGTLRASFPADGGTEMVLALPRDAEGR